jgi:hypothetical protein
MATIKASNGYDVNVQTATIPARPGEWAKEPADTFPRVHLYHAKGQRMDTRPAMDQNYRVDVPLVVELARYVAEDADMPAACDTGAAAVIKAIYSDEWFGGVASDDGTTLTSITYDYDRPDMDWPGQRFALVTLNITVGVTFDATNP